jgi:hypothetical protein
MMSATRLFVLSSGDFRLRRANSAPPSRNHPDSSVEAGLSWRKHAGNFSARRPVAENPQTAVHSSHPATTRPFPLRLGSKVSVQIQKTDLLFRSLENSQKEEDNNSGRPGGRTDGMATKARAPTDRRAEVLEARTRLTPAVRSVLSASIAGLYCGRRNDRLSSFPSTVLAPWDAGGR